MNAPALEPQALELRPDDNGRISLSVAISLKRIADRLDALDVTKLDLTIFGNQLLDIAYQAGVNFRGRA